MARRDGRREIQLLPEPSPPESPPSPGSPGRPGGPGPQVPPGGTNEDGLSGDRTTDWGRWSIAVGLVVAAVLAVIVFDRADQRQVADPVTPPTVDTQPAPPPTPAPLTEGQVSLPPGLEGTLYALGEDETLVEVDLPTGRTRVATLDFDVAPWFVSQVVALQDVVLVVTRRQVFSIDRATLSEQHRVAEQRWVVAAASGQWAALVPFGAGAATVQLLDGAGVPLGQEALQLPSGVTVQGAVADGLVIDATGTLQVMGTDGRVGAVIGGGRFLASGADAVASMVCAGLDCTLRAGTLTQPGRVQLSGVEIAGSWMFGPGAVFDPTGQLLALISPLPGGGEAAVVLDLAANAGPADSRMPRPQQSPVVPRSPSALPALAFSADGSALIHTSANGVVLVQLPRFPNGPAAVAELAFPGAILAVYVTPLPPPPPPPQPSGPPPSFA